MVGDVHTTAGFSGSGVFDKNNNLIGLVTGKIKAGRRAYTYIIPISLLESILSKSEEVVKDYGYHR